MRWLYVLLLPLAVACCVHVYPAGTQPPAAPIAAKSSGPEVSSEKPLEKDQVYVCAIGDGTEGKFHCITFEQFMAAWEEKSGSGGGRGNGTTEL